MHRRVVFSFSAVFGFGCPFFIVAKADNFKKSTPPGHTFILNPPLPLPKDPPELKSGKLICKYGFPSTTNLSFFATYVASVNYRTRIPNWVAERLTRETLQEGAVCRKERFKIDTETPEIFRATNRDYRDSGFDRGHLTPAADHKITKSSMGSTFLLSTNMVPQDREINRGLWLQLEKIVRRLTKWFDEVYVVTGPLFLPEHDAESGKNFVKYEVIGARNVAVPTHLFKVVLAVKDKQMFNAAWIIPNTSHQGIHRLVDYQQSLETVEYHSGLRFFPAVNRERLHNVCSDFKKCTLLDKKLWSIVGEFELAESISDFDRLKAKLPYFKEGTYAASLVKSVVSRTEQRLLNT